MAPRITDSGAVAKTSNAKKRRPAKKPQGEKTSDQYGVASDEVRGSDSDGGTSDHDSRSTPRLSKPGDSVLHLVASVKQPELDKKQIEEDKKKLEQEVQELKAALENKDEVIAETDKIIAENDDVIAKKDKVIAEKNKTINEQKARIGRRDYTIKDLEGSAIRRTTRSNHQKHIIEEQKKVLDKYDLGKEVPLEPQGELIPRGAFPSSYRPSAEEYEEMMYLAWLDSKEGDKRW
ncbi:hypothetical protein M409DRAFT_30107 [Zasmidium cellare ATCC 36951]|uniref:Uncharacterized protein n=1 Tax=Zasmidium cellare ATCC 36951 TaxID=1080233 RepID=A0A6A6C196_ZASCE|nr:uncharacterized protein M409DRAFT_30107 [Zasmidium cellare ATCC 36951]KAF2159486.1 hypothetical protein M409DRAFT_30107 [Zasmidium cellare ATCC 36951]